MISKKTLRGALLVLGLISISTTGLILLRRSNRPTASSPAPSFPTTEAAPDSMANRDYEMAPFGVADSAIGSDAPAGIATSIKNVPVPLDTTALSLAPKEPALSDTLRRYGPRATAMQMLIELLEEKQLLMEEKVELSRQLEIVEILDSAIVHNSPPDTSAPEWPAANYEHDAGTDSLPRLDSLFLVPPLLPDTSTTIDAIPPQN